MGVSSVTAESLRSDGHDVTHVFEIGLDRAADAGIMDRALAEGRCVLTFDLDFGDLLALRKAALPSVVLLRLQDQTTGAVTVRLRDAIATCGRDLATGAIVVVEASRCRVRRLPITAP